MMSNAIPAVEQLQALLRRNLTPLPWPARRQHDGKLPALLTPFYTADSLACLVAQTSLFKLAWDAVDCAEMQDS